MAGDAVMKVENFLFVDFIEWGRKANAGSGSWFDFLTVLGTPPDMTAV
jgi:hypothetical protein